jgi:hypothetical protein
MKRKGMKMKKEVSLKPKTEQIDRQTEAALLEGRIQQQRV